MKPSLPDRMLLNSSTSLDSSEQEIIDGIKVGSAHAFRQVYSCHGRSVLTYLTRFTGKREVAEDLTQETFLSVIKKIGFFRNTGDGGFRAWIFRIATNLAIDHLRREKKMVLSSSDSSFPPPIEIDEPLMPVTALEKHQLNLQLSSAILMLPPAQRLILLLKEQEDMSLIEISRVCGCSENAVKQSLFRARASLRRKLCE